MLENNQNYLLWQINTPKIKLACLFATCGVLDERGGTQTPDQESMS